MKLSLTNFHDNLLKMGPETGWTIYYSIKHPVISFDIVYKITAAFDDNISG